MIMKNDGATWIIVGISLTNAACVLPWGDGKGTDSSGTGSSNSAVANVSEEVAALCEKLAPAGCVTACKTVGDCSLSDLSLITKVDCSSSYSISFETKSGNRDYCGIDANDLADNEDDQAIVAARKRVFVTSSEWTGNLVASGKGADGISSADKLCSQAATAAELGGKWKAVLGTAASSAEDRITDSKLGWFDVTRSVLLFSNKANLSTTIRDSRSLTDENGSQNSYAITYGYVWWTIGSSTADETCADWTNGESSYGSARRCAYFDGSTGSLSCSSEASLFCVEQ